MKLRQKIVSLFAAAVTAVSALSVTAFATDPVGSNNPIELKDGVEGSAQIKFDDSYDYDNGHNYADFRFTAPTEGIMVLTFDAAINNFNVNVYEGEYKTEISPKTRETITGGFGENSRHYMDANAGLGAATETYEVKKTDYIIRISRAFKFLPFIGLDRSTSQGMEGNGRVHITAAMQKPDAPTDIKVSNKTDTSFTLTWAEPDNADSYDIRYKASSAKSWTTVEDIKDNKATISKLKAATKYTYCVRSKAGDIAGDWSKAATVTTSDPKNVKIAAPTVNNAKLTVEISWKSVKNATGYNVKYSTDQKKWTTVSVTDTSCSIPVTAGKTYYYAVQGKNSAKAGTWSATKSIKVG